MDFKDNVVYQIYIKSFKDSNGDGIGDLKGITEKLDYLAGLGVDYLWLTPFYRSPQRDSGYDISDYYSVEPMFGTMEDFDELVSRADRKGLGLMLDMVLNHTSTEHDWFQRALAGDPKYLDYYIFREGGPGGPPTNWESKFGGSAWEYVPHLKKWYLHLFDRTQADLNWDNPEVREELKNVIRFWKKKGVKGFRFDVVNLISKPKIFCSEKDGDGRRFYTDGPHVHEYLKELTADTGISDMITVGEMSSTSLENCIRYTNPMEKELSMVFNFHHLKIDYKNGDKWELCRPDYRVLKELLEKWQLGMQQADGWNALFWCNHDQPRIVSRLGDEKRYWKESAKMLASCIHMLRGTPYIFQGEELGMTSGFLREIGQYRDVESKNYYEIMRSRGKSEQEAMEVLRARSRDNGRTPMQWTSGKYAGFSSGQPWIDLPQNSSYINAEQEEKDPDSILNYYKELIRLRKSEPAVKDGKIEFLCRGQEAIFAYRRILGDQEILVFNNFTEKEVIPDFAWDDAVYEKLLGNYQGIRTDRGKLALRPYESIICKASSVRA